MRTVRIAVLVCFVLVAVMAAPLARPTEASAAITTWWVDIAHGNNSNSGTSVSPLRNISAAITRAHAGDTIMVRPGTYGSEFAQSFPIEIPPGVALKSSGGAYATTIESNGSQRVMSIHDAAVGTTVSGFTITGGAGDGAGIMVTRDAVGVVDGWPLIEKCVLTGNGSAAVTGGALYINGCQGGLVHARLVDTTVRDNTADEHAVHSGQYSDVHFQRCFIEDNACEGVGVTAQMPGGASLDQCTVAGNSKGGVYVSGSGAISITDCNITRNTGGCGLYTYGCNPTVSRTLISGNTALAEGGGVGYSYSNPTFSDCIIAGNIAPVIGGAVWGASGLATFRNCTIADNSSPGGWDGIYAETGNWGSVALKNCIVWGHGNQDVRGASSISYTCTQDTNLADDLNTVGAGVIHGDPDFAVPWWGYYRIETLSPCIDAGDPVDYSVKDYYGKTRPVDGDGDGIGAPDMGAYEYLRAKLSASAPASVVYGGRALVTATLRDARGDVVPGRWVRFDYSTDDVNFDSFASGKTDSSGVAAVMTPLSSSRTSYMCRLAQDEEYPYAESSLLTVKPKTHVSTPVAPSKMSHAKSYTVYGYLKPRHTSGSYPVRIYKYRYVRGAWRRHDYVSAAVSNYSSYSKYSRSLRLPHSGRWRLRAYAPADTLHAAAWSSGYDYVTVK